ncbi:Peptidase S11, D-alanyl-D-alanine carboxypeptidase A [Moorella glycerini]|uniref:serine-type D-Ala-D-Ala carboxypeptidase n=1 Tax=Neomoorella stamsii TaxID=1266720 RepID=A0A9X7J1I7_9FIRM|nr:MULTISPECIES: D-alanyl-D-alanine carboxypeptidase family protein [Moorella]PRR72005.1 D-alanyl-D-alanine carboxypeptidase DacF precursor [Moorella stamsii]CEP66821.1 Peptidase S11, D-alanyl-D-alanine carboxypeptidase A [Moorella glycerini]
MRRLAYGLLIIIACLFWSGAAKAAGEPYLTAPAVVLMEAGTGQVLYEHGAREERPPASTTKIMTAILALELGRLDTPVKVSKYAATTPGASIYLTTGEVVKLGDLVKGALLNSGNDATVAIAESLAGTEEDFAWLMNRKARQLGANHTHFKNPHGLPDPGHYTTAYDLALMTRYALGNPVFRRLVATQEDQIPAPDGVRYLYNTNRLLGSYPGADGVKTGTTNAAGQCLVASATRGGRQLIAVVLGSSDRYADARALLDYGFNGFYTETARAGEPAGQVYVKNGEVISVPVAPVVTTGFTVSMDQAALLEKRVLLPAFVKAPISKGQELGQVKILFQGREVASSTLVATRDVAALPWWSMFKK